MDLSNFNNTGPHYSPRFRNIEREHQQWNKAHQRIKNGPTQEGRDYVRHAKNLLPLLEGFAELHPIAKAVVVSFKAALSYESERQENDARVAVLYLSQSEMMGTLLDVNKHSKRRNARQNDDDEGPLHSNSILLGILDRVKEEILACGNSIDTYYKQKRFVKFWKSQEWRDRILGHATTLNQFRASIQQTLLIQVASDGGTMLEKMDVLLSRLFTPTKWEKETMTKYRQLTQLKDSEDSADLINDIDDLQILVATTRDPLLDCKASVKEDSPKSSIRAALPTQIEQLKKELHLSLDVLCDRNQEMFERKLNYHMRQLQEAVLNAAQYVVQSLSGPYDRLHNEDLKILWKEMNWHFCVDDKLFTSALFEYYLDHLSAVQHKPKQITASEENDEVQEPPAENEAEMRQENLTKFTFLSRLGLLNHVDAWTLELIAMYGDRISSAIDRDESGFIRISEANTFTEQMPKGWSLLQWCAYAALGESYESRIYRIRIRNILDRMMEMQEKVLPLNRGLVAILTVPHIIPFFQLMAWEPTTSEPDAPAELRLLVHEKIKQQDDVWRQALASFNWSVEDEATLRLLYGKKALETYILQLSTLLLEYAYDVMQACCVVVIDIKEMSHILSPLIFLELTCSNRVASLQTQFQKEKKPSDYLDTFSGGIWFAIRHGRNPDDWETPLQLPFRPAYDADFQIVLQDFPLHHLPDKEHLPYLKYKTWEDHIRPTPQGEIPERIPNSWNAETEDDDETSGEEYGYDLRYNWTHVPLTSRGCDKCGKNPIPEFHYACATCSDFDFCSECWKLPAAEHTHTTHNFSHLMLRFALHPVIMQRNGLIVDAQVAIRRLQEVVAMRYWDWVGSQIVSPRSPGGRVVDEDEEARYGNGNSAVKETRIASPFLCNHCQETIPLDGATFYKCMKHSCVDYMVCDSCASKQIVNDNPEGHQWWHALLVLDGARIVGTGDIESSEVKEGQDIEPIADIPSESIEDIISEVNAKLDTTNSILKEALSSRLEDKVKAVHDGDETISSDIQAMEKRMSQLECKVDGMVMELRGFLESVAQRLEI